MIYSTSHPDAFLFVYPAIGTSSDASVVATIFGRRDVVNSNFSRRTTFRSWFCLIVDDDVIQLKFNQRWRVATCCALHNKYFNRSTTILIPVWSDVVCKRQGFLVTILKLKTFWNNHSIRFNVIFLLFIDSWHNIDYMVDTPWNDVYSYGNPWLISAVSGGLICYFWIQCAGLKITIVPTLVIVTGRTLYWPVIKKICPVIKNVLSIPYCFKIVILYTIT